MQLLEAMHVINSIFSYFLKCLSTAFLIEHNDSPNDLLVPSPNWCVINDVINWIEWRVRFCPLWRASRSERARRWWIWWRAWRSRCRCSSGCPPPPPSPSLTPETHTHTRHTHAGAEHAWRESRRSTCLVMNPLINLLLVVQDHEGLGGSGVSAEDEAQVSSLTLHIAEVDQCSVQTTHTHTHYWVMYIVNALGYSYRVPFRAEIWISAGIRSNVPDVDALFVDLTGVRG